MDFQLTTNNIIFLNMMLTNKHIYDTLCSSKHGFICFLISFFKKEQTYVYWKSCIYEASYARTGAVG